MDGLWGPVQFPLRVQMPDKLVTPDHRHCIQILNILCSILSLFLIDANLCGRKTKDPYSRERERFFFWEAGSKCSYLPELLVDLTL